MNRKAKWKYALKGVRSVTQRAPVICGTNVLATFNHGQDSNFQGTLTAIDIQSGQESWRFDTGHFLNEPCVTDDEEILISCFDGSAYKLTSDGTLLWETQASKRNVWAGLHIQDKFYYAEIAGQSNYTRALSANNGEIIWEYQNGGHSYSLATDFIRCVVHSSVTNSFDNQKVFLHCLDKNTGKLIWKIQYEHYLFHPLIIDNYIYIGSRGHIALFCLVSGKLLARHRIAEGVAVTARPIKTSKGVIFVSEKGHFFCLEAFEAKRGIFRKKYIKLTVLWDTNLSHQIKASSVIEGSQLLVISEAGNLVKINIDSGNIESQEKLSGFKEGFGMAVFKQDLFVSVSRECKKL